MSVFNIDGLTYTDELPHSRIERILYKILKKEGGGGGDYNIGNGLKIVGNKLVLDTSDNADTSSNKPITSNAVYNELEKTDTIMSGI